MRKNKKILLKLIFIIFCVIFIVGLSTKQSLALDEESDSVKFSGDVEEYSEDYKRWLELPEEERKNTIQPSPYYTSYNPEASNANKLERYSINSNFNAVALANILPTYDLRDHIDISVKNQLETQSCWTFPLISEIETNISLTRGYRSPIFSTRHMEYATSKTFLDGINPNGYNREVGGGGNSYIGMSYMASGNGPVLETDMPFVNSEAKINLSEINKQSGQHLESYVRFPSIIKELSDGVMTYKDANGQNLTEESINDIRQQIKEHIITYGGVSANTNSSQTQFFNNISPILATAYYCDDASITQDHLVTIVGWDDNYSKDNFNPAHKPAKDGAWLVLNSYGTGFNSGYYYISYEDVMVEKENTGTISISDKDYKYVYQYDNLGSNVNIGLNGNDAPLSTVYLANLFTRKDSSAEYLSEVSVYSVKDCTVDVYVNPTGELNTTGATLVASGLRLQEEYRTIKITNPITLTNNQFAVIVKYSSTDGSQVKIPLEAKVAQSPMWDTATANPNEGYVSTIGTGSWQDITSLSIGGIENTSICIKAFTKDADNIGPTITFETNGDTNYKRTQGTKVSVSDTSGINNSSLRYVWTQSTSQPIISEFNGSFENNSVVSNSTDSGNNWYLWVVAKDIQGNTTYKRSEAFYLDNTPPTAPNISSNAQNNIYTKDNAIIDISGSTALSGIAKYQYSLNNGGSWNDVSGSISITKSGIYQIKARAVSNVGLTGTESKTYIIKIDNEAPKVIGVEEGKSYKEVSPTITDDTEITATIQKEGEEEKSYNIKNNIGETIEESGNYTLTVTDELGNETIIHFTIDASGPEIIFSPNGNTTYQKTQSTKVTVVDLDSDIDDSSLKYKWIKNASDVTEDTFDIDANSFTNGDTITINKGTGNDYILAIIAKDILGNTTIAKSNSFYLDNEKPTVPKINSNISSGSATNKEVEITINGSTSLCGIKRYEYSLDDGEHWTEISEGEKITFTESKTYSLIARAVNNLETVGDQTEKYTVTISKTAPVINFSPNGNSLYKRSHTVQINITHDRDIDIGSLKYIWSQSTEKPNEDDFINSFTNGATVEKDTESGTWYVWAMAKDTLGNTSIVKSEAFYLDNELPPAPTISSNAENGVYIEEDAVVTISGSSSPSGIKKYKYSTNNQVSWTDVQEDERITFNQDGIYTIYASAVNNVGRTGEVTQPYVIKIDKTAPIVEGVEEGKKYSKVIPIIKDATEVTTELTKDGEPISYSEGQEINEDGEYKLIAKDIFNHTTIVNFIIDSTPPTIIFNPNGNTTYAKSQSTQVNVSDEYGLDETTLRYKWTQSVQVLTEDTFLPNSKTFTNGSNISIDKVSGDNWYLWVYAKDLQGNMSLMKTSNFCLDNEIPTAPTISATIKNGESSKDNVNINITGGSSPSGIAKYQYSLNNGQSWTDIKVGETLVAKDTGIYNIIARAVNNVGTEGEISQKYIITVDKDGPNIEFLPNGNQTFAKTQSSTVKVKSISGLTQNGLKYLWSTQATGIEEDDFTQTFVNNQKISKNTDSGAWYLWIYAKDKLGNIKIQKSESFNLDNEIPTAPTIQSDTISGTVIEESLEFTISGSSSPSGIAKYQYSLDNGKSWYDIAIGEKVVVSKSGKHQIKARAVNNVGTIGKETETSYDVTIDKSPLNVLITPNGNTTYAKSQSTQIKVETSNELETLKYLWSQKSEGVSESEIINDFENNQTITKNTDSGPWYLWVFVEDNVGKRVIQNSGAFYLDNDIPDAPIISKKAIIENDTVEIDISGSSSPSGIAKYQYSLDNGKTWKDLQEGEKLILNEIGDYEFLARAVNNVGTIGKETQMEIVEVVTKVPLIQFEPNGNNKYEKEQSTKVRIRSSIELDDDSFYYVWTNGNEEVTEDDITNKLNNNEIITKDTESGSWYLWIIAKNVDNEVKISKSEAFKLDNDTPIIAGVEDGKVYEDAKITVTDETSNVTVKILKDGKAYTYNKSNKATKSNYTEEINFSENGVYQITASDEAGNTAEINFVIQNKEKDITGPIVTFTPNGNKKYQKVQETEVKVADPSGVDEDSLMYIWTDSEEQPNKEEFIKKFNNNDKIKNDKGTGKLYLWIYAKDKLGNESILRSNEFYLDNSKPNPPTIDVNIKDGETTDDDVIIKVNGDTTESNEEYEYSTDGGKTWNKVENGEIVISKEGTTTIIFRTINEVGTISTITEPLTFTIKRKQNIVNNSNNTIANNTISDNTIAKDPIPQTGLMINVILTLMVLLGGLSIIIIIRYLKLKTK